ncbi:hypothetical protein [Brachybacterium sp. UNK5269]|uniref:hypothetical protein n=1 Tax=Brachybacterium sp. UNK5269 TaxID=3408576 RepID=UPI003BB20A4C
MTAPFSRPLPPLRDLPAPRPVPREETNLVPPGEIIAESKRAITGRLLRICWKPGLVLLGLWYLLLGLYVLGASPSYWMISLLASLAEPGFLRSTMASLGFTSSGLWAAFLLLPAVATALSLALLPLAATAIAALQPRRFLTERDFQREVAARITAVLMIPPVLALLAVPLSVLVRVPQPWSGLGPGPLSALSLALGGLLIARPLLQRCVSAPAVLGITAASELEATARLDRDLDRRRAAAEQVQAQDRRHLPPTPGSPDAAAPTSLRAVAAALGAVGRASLAWLWPAVAGLGAVLFGVADWVVVLTGFGTTDLTAVSSSPGYWQQLVLAVPVLALVVVGVGLTPAAGVRLAESQRSQVRDQRTYPSWEHRRRVNPWEERAVALTGWISAGVGLLGVVLFWVVTWIVPVGTALSTVWCVAAALVLAPLLGAAAAAGMRGGLRDVLYGPAGDYMRRPGPYALVAPEVGTRADRAADPAVRAALRKRLQAGGGDQALEIFDLDAAGERLWVEDAEPGATDTAVREADLARGVLPDFGAEGSAFTGGGLAPGDPGARHRIPDQVRGLQED